MLACGKGDPNAETGPLADADADADADTDTDADADADTDTDTDTWNHAVGTLAVASRDEGFDLDEDGDVDNAIWLLGGAIDPLVAAQITAASRVLVLQTAGWDDGIAEIGLFGAEDTDGDPSDNFTGSEAFDAGEAVDDQGRARASVEAPLVDGDYEVALVTEALSVGELSLEATTPIYLRGTVDASSHVGTLGFGASVQGLVAAATALGANPTLVKQLEDLADLDTDGDGTSDAISTAWTFEAVACDVSP
jgi:hypothetical protein